MELDLDKKQTFKERFIFFLKKNKLKLFFLIGFILFFLISIILFIEHKKKENSLLSEKYIKASLFLSKNKNKQAKNYFEQIILSENKFYSLLALNTILEKKLIDDNGKILNYFKNLEKINYSEELKDLIQLKKSLYFLQIKDYKSGEKILNDLINKNSTLKSVAQEIIE